jgi:hypothetical protein
MTIPGHALRQSCRDLFIDKTLFSVYHMSELKAKFCNIFELCHTFCNHLGSPQSRTSVSEKAPVDEILAQGCKVYHLATHGIQLSSEIISPLFDGLKECLVIISKL